MTERPKLTLLRGDESDLFVRYDEPLRRATHRAINTTPENVQDACAYAWGRLLARQPERETVFAWLKTVARNEALRLDRADRGFVHEDLADYAEVIRDHRDPIRGAESLLEGRDRLAPLREGERAAML